MQKDGCENSRFFYAKNGLEMSKPFLVKLFAFVLC